MQMRTIVTLVIAVLVGLLAVFMVQKWVGGQRGAIERNAAQSGTVPVVVASRPIERGRALAPLYLKVVRFPEGSAPPDAASTVAELTTGPERLALRPIAANEPILKSRITTPGGKANLSATLSAGMRAITFRSNDVTGVAGFVLPGDRVDVLLTRETANTAGGNPATVTQVVAENLKILGVDQNSNEDATKPVVVKAITLEVTPDQAQAIALAQAVGDVALSLRQLGDEAPVDKRVTTVADLGGRSAAPQRTVVFRAARPARAAAPKRPSAPTNNIRVTRGVATTDYTVSR